MVILMFVVAMPGHFGHAELLVEGLGAAVDGERVKDEILAFPPGLVHECADEAGTDAALMIGVDLHVDPVGPHDEPSAAPDRAVVRDYGEHRGFTFPTGVPPTSILLETSTKSPGRYTPRPAHP